MGRFLDISVLNRRAENCPELPGLPLIEMWHNLLITGQARENINLAEIML